MSFPLQGEKVTLMDEDAYVVGLSFFPLSLATSLATKNVQMIAELAGVRVSICSSSALP